MKRGGRNYVRGKVGPFISLTLVSSLVTIFYLLHLSKTYFIDDDSMFHAPPDLGRALKKSKNDTGIEFSACLLIKDENFNLPEWIAYHYQMANLRHLVVCVDPFSDSSPLEIIDRWKNLELMAIDSWVEGKKRMGLMDLPPWKRNNAYLARQRSCYGRCMKLLNESNRSWTMMIDVDEYLTFNAVADDDENHTNMEINASDPDSSRVLFGEMTNLMKARLRVPKGGFTNNSSGTITDFIQEERNNMPWIKPCVVFPRLQFSDREEVARIANRGMPIGFQASDFATLKYFSHGVKGLKEHNRLGKSIVDVSRMPTFEVANPHSIVKGLLCGAIGPNHLLSPLRVNHYLITKRNNWTYHNRSTVRGGISYEMQGWLQSFVLEVGAKTAQHLLTGARSFDQFN